MQKGEVTITHGVLDLEVEPEEWRRYYERRIQEIRSGVERTTGRFWTFDEFKRLADEPQAWGPR